MVFTGLEALVEAQQALLFIPQHQENVGFQVVDSGVEDGACGAPRENLFGKLPRKQQRGTSGQVREPSDGLAQRRAPNPQREKPATKKGGVHS